MVPQLGRSERQRDETLDAETAEAILEYLSKYHFASRNHVLFALLWETGIRIGATNSLDVNDVFQRR